MAYYYNMLKNYSTLIPASIVSHPCSCGNKPIGAGLIVMDLTVQQEIELSKKWNCSRKAHNANQRCIDKISKWDVMNVLKQHSFKCHYCYDALKPSKWQLDHFFSVSRGGKNTSVNIVPTCNWCNLMKNSLDGFSFILKCRKIADMTKDRVLPFPNKYSIYK